MIMNRMLILLLVGMGGLLGSVTRYLISLALNNLKFISHPFPYGTFVVNIIGCLLIGLFYGISKNSDSWDSYFSLFFITGFCGGFTTFSTFSFENIELLQQAKYLHFIIYSVGSFAIGLLAVVAGLLIVKYVF